jgi:hypothetical protein
VTDPAGAASATRSIIASLPRTFFSSSVSSLSTFFAARARQASTCFSDTSANRPAGTSSFRTRWSLSTSANKLSSPGRP